MQRQLLQGGDGRLQTGSAFSELGTQLGKVKRKGTPDSTTLGDCSPID